MSDRAILFEEPRKSAHLCSSALIIITRKRLCSDSIRDSIRTKISDSQVHRSGLGLVLVFRCNAIAHTVLHVSPFPVNSRNLKKVLRLEFGIGSHTVLHTTVRVFYVVI